MKKMLTLCVLFWFACALFACAPSPSRRPARPNATSAQSKTTFVTIGTGGITGVYYPTGGAIAKMVNKKRKQCHIRCAVESTDGSVFNLNGVMSGDMEFGIVQSDRQYQAMKGLAEWKGNPQEDLRAVFSIYSESLTLVATSASGIRGIKDLKGKRVNIGTPDSGHHQNAVDALLAVGINHERDVISKHAKAAQAPGLLSTGQIDAFFYTVGHPNSALREAISRGVGTWLIPVSGPEIDTLIRKTSYYAKSVIPVRKFYPTAANGEDMIDTFGVNATLVTSAKVPDRVVYAITKAVFENFEAFRTLHPAYEILSKKGMLEGLSAPIHPGAMRYYKEVGLI